MDVIVIRVRIHTAIDGQYREKTTAPIKGPKSNWLDEPVGPRPRNG